MESNHFWLGFYIIGFLWFMIVSPVFIVIKMIGIDKAKKAKMFTKHHSISLYTIWAGVIFVLVAASIGLMVTR